MIPSIAAIMLAIGVAQWFIVVSLVQWRYESRIERLEKGLAEQRKLSTELTEQGRNLNKAIRVATLARRQGVESIPEPERKLYENALFESARVGSDGGYHISFSGTESGTQDAGKRYVVRINVDDHFLITGVKNHWIYWD